MFRDCDEQAIVAHGNSSLGQRILASLLLNSHDDETWMVYSSDSSEEEVFFFSFLIGESISGSG